MIPLHWLARLNAAGLLVVLLLATSSAPLPARHASAAVAAESERSFVPGEVLARWTVLDARARLLGEIGGTVLPSQLPPSVDLIEVPDGSELPAVDALTRSGSVLWAQPNYLRQAQSVPADPMFTQQWGLQKIQAPQAWDLTTGASSVVVAIVDTGIDLGHPELQGKIVEGYNFLDPDLPPQDDGGHGTHVAGTIAATQNNGIGIAGIAPNTSIMPVKVLKANGSGKDSTVAEGMRWAVDHGARIINMSFSGAEVSPVLTEAVAYAQSRNVILVVAAGNDAAAAPTYPAATDPVIAVAATDQSDRRAYYSNYGDWIDISAPGTAIMSTSWLGGSTYRADTGTSMAAPHVTGVIALLLAVRPELSPSEVESILKSTADPLPDAGMGAGRLNAARALAAVKQPSPPTSSGGERSLAFAVSAAAH